MGMLLFHHFCVCPSINIQTRMNVMSLEVTNTIIAATGSEVGKPLHLCSLW